MPGDVVLLQAGDKVPADLRLVRGRDLQVDESALTGESLPVDKRREPVAHDQVLAERTNMAYASSLVTFGQGTGVVVGTGDDTEVGRISELISGAEDLQTPLTQKIAAFSKLLLVVILALGAVTFVVGLLRGESWVYMFKAAVALAVGAIPEGLPAAVTITLAIGVSRMARRRAIIRKLPAVETLGSTTVICTDKTGTLTENQMTVQRIVAGGRTYEVSGTGYEPAGTVVDPRLGRGAGETAPCARRCARSSSPAPSATTASSCRTTSAGRCRATPPRARCSPSPPRPAWTASSLQAEAPRVDSIPFESLHQYMATMHDPGEGRPRAVYVKGGVEVVLDRCTDALDADGKRLPLERGGGAGRRRDSSPPRACGSWPSPPASCRRARRGSPTTTSPA